jgi:hypothetical protein
MKTRGRKEWSAQAIEKLKKMRADGISNGFIADELGKSRSAVAGMIRRLKLPLAPGVRNNFNPHSHAVRRTRAAIKRAIPLLKLEVFHCRAVIQLKGRDGLATFCGHQKMPGSAWCPAHHKLYTEPERYPLNGQAGKHYQRF